ncbi:MAG: hypothetical protein WDN02_05100 [Methylovirgula sp.]|uniref:hypothetical protein n=1 Tax=Methylovirgula sp. TaxID=1978224 RepID=UPI003076284D
MREDQLRLRESIQRLATDLNVEAQRSLAVCDQLGETHGRRPLTGVEWDMIVVGAIADVKMTEDLRNLTARL